MRRSSKLGAQRGRDKGTQSEGEIGRREKVDGEGKLTQGSRINLHQREENVAARIAGRFRASHEMPLCQTDETNAKEG